MRYLKKTGFIITTALFLMLFIACGGNDDRQSPPGQTPPSDKTPLPDPKPPSDQDTLDTEPPTVPRNLTATAISSTEIELSWDESTDDVGVAGYKIYRNNQVSTLSSPDAFYLDDDLSPSTEYCYRVSALDEAGNESDKSDQACATTTDESGYYTNPDPDPPTNPDPDPPANPDPDPPTNPDPDPPTNPDPDPPTNPDPDPPTDPDPDPPTDPRNLTATVISSTEIELLWQEPTDNAGVAGYRIYRDNLYLTYTSAALYMDEDLLPSTEYCYRVSAFDAAGNESAKSNQACAKTDDPAGFLENPMVPRNLTATAVSHNEIRLTWMEPTNNADVSYYKIYRDDDSYISSTTLLWHSDIDGLTPLTTYCYQVSAVDDWFEYDKSDPACAETLSDDNPFSVDGINMAPVQGGTFIMGCTAEQLEDCDNKGKPAHTVTLSGFYMGRYEVTQKLWKDVMGDNPSVFKGDNLPVENVTFDEVQDFIKKLNVNTGRTGTGREYRLPTEAEWEYAARGAENNGCKYSGSNDIGEVAWHMYNSATEIFPLGTTHHVGTKKPNGLGLYDMSGNVSEWVSDFYSEYSPEPQTNPKGPDEGLYLLARGGGFSNSERYLRLSFRNYVQPDAARKPYKSQALGFRLAADN